LARKYCNTDETGAAVCGYQAYQHKTKDYTMNDMRHIIVFLIPIVAIVMGVGLGMLGLFLDYQKKTRMFDLHHKERLLAIERGMEVPPLPSEFFAPVRKPVNLKANSLRWGLIWLFLGLALGTAMALNDGIEQASWALLPIAVGVALLSFYKLDPSPAPADAA
jgi:hypothetical protein